MAYTVLARKYRSQTFDDVVGQEPIARTLKNAIKTDKVAHAFLFTGTRGVGKTTMARVLAKALNCLSFDAPTAQPCCKCQSCIAVNLGDDIDVIEIDGATNNGVEQVRELRQNAIYRPARARFKIYIIDEVHMLSPGAFNALLKILEEPPSHVKFIFATTEPNKVIATIQSRCQRFDFSNISPAAIAGQLKSILEQEKIKYEEDLILPIAKMANGSMRDALSLLDRLISAGAEPLTASLLEEYLGCPNSEKIYNLIGQIGENNAAGTLEAIEDLIGSGLSEAQIADSLIEYMRDLMVVKSTGPKSKLLVLTAEQQKRVSELAEKFDIAGLIYNIAAIEKLRWTVKNSDTPRALLEACLLRLALSEHFLNVDTLIAKLHEGGAKKKQISSPNPAARTPAEKVESLPKEQAERPRRGDVESIKSSWPSVLKLITDKLGNGTGGLLSKAEPARFENGLLTLAFSSSAEVFKKMCDSNGRTEQIQSLLGEYFGTPVRLEFETSADKQTNAVPKPPSLISQRHNELINDPAVKMVLMELDATITDVDAEQ